MYVAGYYLTYATVRALMSKLEIDDRGVEDFRLEYPVNNFLAEQGKYNMLAGAISHPVTGDPTQEDGILIMTQFLETDESNPVVEEQNRDIRVKQWLLHEGGVKPDEMEWMSLWDRFYLTPRNGISPRRNNVHGHVTPADLYYPHSKVVPPDMVARWMTSGLGMEEFLENEAREGRWEK
jgi:hypothetical protein